MKNLYVPDPTSAPSSPSVSSYAEYSGTGSVLDPPQTEKWLNFTTSFRHHPNIPEANAGLFVRPETLPMRPESSLMALQHDHNLYSTATTSYSLTPTPAPTEYISSERIDNASTSSSPEAPPPTVPSIKPHQHHQDSTVQPPSAQIPTAVEEPTPENKTGMAAQWKLLNSVGRMNFGLIFICLEVFLLEFRKTLGSPGEDKVFDDAFERTLATVIGTGRFINEAQYLKTKLKDIYNSIEPIYDDGAGILRARILEFYPELVVASHLERDTDEWRIAMRATAQELMARPGGYLHLVCAFHPFNNLTQLTQIRRHRVESFLNTSTLDFYAS